jgi:hypothetical protein
MSLFKQDAASPGVALVLHRPGEPLVELMPPLGLTRSGLFSDVRAIYRIDVSEHPLHFELRLPTARSPHQFIAHVDLTCAVRRPALVVEGNLTDVRLALQPRLEETMLGVSRGFTFEQGTHAEHAIRRSLRDQATADGFHPALSVPSIAVRLYMDEATSSHLAQQSEQDRRIERSLALQDVIDGRRGSLAAIYLDGNLDKAGDLISHIAQQQQVDFDRRIQALKFLLDHDVIEAGQLAEAGEHGVLGRDILDAVLPRPAAPPLRLEAGRESDGTPGQQPPKRIRTVGPVQSEETS